MIGVAAAGNCNGKSGNECQQQRAASQEAPSAEADKGKEGQRADKGKPDRGAAVQQLTELVCRARMKCSRA